MENLAGKLEEIRRLAGEVLAEIGQRPPTVRKGGSKPRASRPARKTLTTQILQLRDGGYFRESKTAQEAHKKLDATYPCELNRVAVALHRLQKRHQLRKTSKAAGKKKQVAYVW